MLFTNISTKDLQAEIDRRLLPELIEPDIKPLQKICQAYVKALVKDRYVGDIEHYVFEIAMETVFGENVWLFINSPRKPRKKKK